jgi:endonuclease/exonuclease/phosphatase family metal-dependent hydrolase
LLFRSRALSQRSLTWLSALVIVTRAVEPVLDTRARMLVAGLGVACFLILFPTLLWHTARAHDAFAGWALGAALVPALALSLLLRASRSGLDLSTADGREWIGWLLALLALGILPRQPLPQAPNEKGANSAGARSDQPVSTLKVTLLALGIASVWALLYFAFNSPHVITRWTGTAYLPVLAMACVVLVLYAYWSVQRSFVKNLGSPAWLPRLLGANLALSACLALTLAGRQLHFPGDPGAYPIFQNPASPLLGVPLLGMLALFPVLLLDFARLAQALIAARPSSRQLGAGFSVAALYLLLLIFANVFTTVYDYIPVVGLLFRDRYWLVFTLPALVAGLALLATRSEPKAAARLQLGGWAGSIPISAGILAAGALIVLPLTAARPQTLAAPSAAPAPAASAPAASAPAAASAAASQSEQAHQARLLTFNIQQGYNAAGREDFSGQLDFIRQASPDLVCLQESDTNRVAGGNSDLVRYFSDQLNLYSYYGPSTVTGTFGIALLSRYPIQGPRTFFMYSQGEQTAAIHARVEIAGKTFNVFVTHLGNDGPLIQQQQFLSQVAGQPDVVACGDFNFDPGTEQYRQTTAVLQDAWLLRWPQGADDRGLNPADRIDHVFVSPGTVVQDAQYLLNSQSDHPAVLVEITW